ncbi:hypothetical protein V5799_015969 [Amblyomma americanum]|uniref:Uncharacterized protein n=1 Tax=Amblyomma americanum TaxID=6943 RepID=A0AAQ4F751_AMBAM
MSSLSVCIHQGCNIIITSTPDLDTANQVRQIDSLKLASKAYAIAAYVPTPEPSKAVIHGLNTSTSETELIDGLRTTFPGVEVLQARMLGAIRTAYLTFNMRNAPRSVIYCGGESLLPVQANDPNM